MKVISRGGGPVNPDTVRNVRCMKYSVKKLLFFMLAKSIS